MIQITNTKTREIITICRNVTATHPMWVHDQLGTSSEAELQQCLDQMSVDDWYDSRGEHLGDDVCGVSMYRDNETIRNKASEEGEAIESANELNADE